MRKIFQWFTVKNKEQEGIPQTELPLRAELFNSDQMERHGKTLALSHSLMEKQGPDLLLTRLVNNESTLLKSHRALSATLEDNHISPGGEWLLDNFYLIEEQIRITKRHLPKGYGKSLPKLGNGLLKGYPRVYDIALQIIAHGDGHWDPESLNRFVFAYQNITPLTLGELWAIPIMLRLALIENLRRVSVRIASDQNDRNLAARWATQMEETAESDPKNLIIVIADMARSDPPMNSPFVAELTRRLERRGGDLALSLNWMEQRLSENGYTVKQLVHIENQQQAANQISVSNSIASLRALNEMDWREFIQTMSVVDQTLQKDPADIYSKMDFATRDRYRHQIERLARVSKKSEKEVADIVLQLAGTGTERRKHVGYYLIGAGCDPLEKIVNPKRFRREKLKKPVLFYFYLGCILVITAALTTGLVFKASQAGMPAGWLAVLGAAAALSTSQLAIAAVNWLAMRWVKPFSLPKMDFSKGIPPEYRTLVVVPAMLSSQATVESLVEALEVRFLGNRDEYLHFALLTDFNDASSEHCSNDALLLDLARERIEALNLLYKNKNGSDIFFLFHRPRLWNEKEQIWMGYERKRGKLGDLNALLREDENAATRFSLIIGCTDILSRIKYVITLDTDTQLPRDSAHHLISAMAHPLNQPYYDPHLQRVTEGYGVLQPRIAEALSSRGLTGYAKLYGAEPGIDPYTRLVSDIYQDLFEEGSFIGKGIYDVDVFKQALENRFPENRILSHDLLEGCYLRSGLLSDVPLYEHSPESYLADVKRRTRWVRGDWQIAGWLLPRVRVGNNQTAVNRLSLLSRWKVFDNLRRSLVPIALMVFLGLSFTLLPHSPFWLAAFFLIAALPSLAGILWELCREIILLPQSHYALTARVAGRRTGQLLFTLACLPYEAWYNLGAIVRTSWRIFITHRRLLEWVPSEQVRDNPKPPLLRWFSTIWAGPAAAFITTAFLGVRHPSLLLWAAPLIILWGISPFLAWRLSQPWFRPRTPLNKDQLIFLRMTARKIWGFFETFYTAEDHWLPPDNYQVAPVAAIAHRTSPTNMGLALLANLSAYDFGYLTLTQLLDRTVNTLQTMNNLERYHGHFYNWYDTQTLSPLKPRFISTVDSGNLAGHLLTLRQGLLALPDEPLFDSRYLNGLTDTLDVLSDLASENYSLVLNNFRQLLRKAYDVFASKPSLSLCTICLEGLYDTAQQIFSLSSPAHHDLTGEWSQKLLSHCKVLKEELKLLSPLPASTPAVTLRELAKTSPVASDQMALIENLSHQIFTLAQMDSSFLYDPVSRFMTVGFNVDEQKRERGCYDMLSSEARLGIFVAIAQGQIPQESWFTLGRLLTITDGEPVLISWSGSMFEYLMPMIVMPTYHDTLLEQTCRAAVNRQISYGKQRSVPWGISESGFNAVDGHSNYQYRAFGVPGLGVMRGLADDLVIAPYATIMALMVDPEMACNNLRRLANEGADGKFGFYEAIDFTPSRLPRGKTHIVIKSFMVHHQGMSFLSLSYLLHNQPMQKRFEADPLFQSTLLLLQERAPRPIASYMPVTPSSGHSLLPAQTESSIRSFESPNTLTPQIQLLSNGHYHLMVTQAGGGYSRWKDIAVTRWREDSTCDNWGLFIYLRDIETGAFWSTTYHPTVGHTENFKALFSEAHAEFSRSDNKCDTYTEIVVSPEDNIELRRVRIYNRAKTQRTIEFTSYGEIALAPQTDDQQHPAFSKLFIETELLPEKNAILAVRRPRSENEQTPFLCHLLHIHSENSYPVSFETDRENFIGRGRTLNSPRAMIDKGDLSGTAGAVLDPIVSIRSRISLEPGAMITIDLITGITENREQCISLIEKYRDHRMCNRVFELAWTHSQVLLRQLNTTEADAMLYGKLAGAILYASNIHRAEPGVLASNRRGQSGLWGYSISGDLPILLLHIEELAHIDLARQLIQAHAYWRQKGLAVDLVILNEEHSVYRQVLQDHLTALIPPGNINDRTGGIFVRTVEQMPAEDKILLESAARVILTDQHGSLTEQLSLHLPKRPAIPRLIPSARQRVVSSKHLSFPDNLVFFNGLGGFSPAGDEYVILLPPGVTTPAPWVNVLANPDFGTVVSESGQSYTWTENAHEFRLTPWTNDPVQDRGGETFYLRDEENGHFWSPTALPRRGKGEYVTRHGFGYSVFEHIEEDIYSELWIYTALDAPVKIMVLKIRNDSSESRRLSATGYVEWVLGDFRQKNVMHVITELADSGALLAHNYYNTEFGERTAFFDASSGRLTPVTRTVTGDRREFLGRNGSHKNPSALHRTRLSGRLGAGLDPCAAIQLAFNLAEGQTQEIVFTLGAAQNDHEAALLIKRFHGTIAAQEALAAVRQYWHRTLHTVNITTPDTGLNLLANGWLLYQVLSSRLWGRSGYYQSGGAFGFRDQLQDVMALVHTEPQRLRSQLLLCAAQQFMEGDVLHWWHPPQNRGVRTRCSDDYLWLPYVLCHYIEATGDMNILNESIPFLQGRLLNPGEESYYDLPKINTENASLYEHAGRAIMYGLKFGSHGLPLIGSGDWNDGMNSVGIHGKGESIWLGFFLYTVLKRFAVLARQYGDEAFARQCDTESTQLQQNLENHGWDGEWYRRAYFDDGTPLGSSRNTECRIDSIAQSWSVLSEAAPLARAKQAMTSLNHYLVKPQDKLVLLLDPPFNTSRLNPGYIKGYVPGVRENGGQYTHAAIWAAMAFAKLGENQLSWSLFTIINPVQHGDTAEKIEVYKIEPYVMAADVYSTMPHTGRGGWSWYTGSAGWMYHFITESLLGLKLQRKHLSILPCIPDEWEGFQLTYHYGKTIYQIKVSRTSDTPKIILDGIELSGNIIPLVDDQHTHEVNVHIIRK